jgi:UDP-N-acetylglucosamine 2-epimerase (non-hydrolysing)
VEAAQDGLEPVKLAVLTTGRQDWGILRSTCLALRESIVLLAGGMHCEARFGSTVNLLVEDGFAPEQLRWAEDDDVHRQAGEALQRVGEALVRHEPDALMLVGDRFETAAAALAATVARVPIIHLHGGEETEGAFDNALRHAITKLADLHLVSHEQHAQRVIAMGEDAANVHVVGAPALDNLRRDDLATREELEKFFGIALPPPVVLVTLHPATLGGDPQAEVAAMIAAMDRFPNATFLITLPNTDPGSATIRMQLSVAARGTRRAAVEALGERRYFGLLRIADAMLGNSSSGIIEAPIVRLPVVNIGDRQKGRLRGDNVLDVPANATAIATALARALLPTFRESLPEGGPFGDGHSAARIVEILKAWTP